MTDLLIEVAALLAGLVEDGKPIAVKDARGVLNRVRAESAVVNQQMTTEAVSEPVIDDLSMMVRRLVLVARRHVEDDHKDLTFANDCLKWLQTKGLAGSPLRDTPPAAVPLTDEQIEDIVREAAKGAATRRDGTTSTRIARAIEQAHGIG